MTRKRIRGYALPSLAQIRIAQEITQAELAARAGVSQLTITHIETGKQNAGKKTIEKLAQVLSTTAEDLRRPQPQNLPDSTPTEHAGYRE